MPRPVFKSVSLRSLTQLREPGVCEGPRRSVIVFKEVLKKKTGILKAAPRYFKHERILGYHYTHFLSLPLTSVY